MFVWFLKHWFLTDSIMIHVRQKENGTKRISESLLSGHWFSFWENLGIKQGICRLLLRSDTYDLNQIFSLPFFLISTHGLWFYEGHKVCLFFLKWCIYLIMIPCGTGIGPDFTESSFHGFQSLFTHLHLQILFLNT